MSDDPLIRGYYSQCYQDIFVDAINDYLKKNK